MAEVEGVAGGAAAGVEVELLALLVGGDDLVELAMGKEHAAAKEGVRLASGDPLDALDERGVDGTAPEVLHELLVVDLPVGAPGDVPGGHHLVAVGGGGGIVERRRGDRGGGVVNAGHVVEGGRCGDDTAGARVSVSGAWASLRVSAGEIAVDGARWIERRSTNLLRHAFGGSCLRSRAAINVMPGRAICETSAIRPTGFGQIPSSQAHV